MRSFACVECISDAECIKHCAAVQVEGTFGEDTKNYNSNHM